MLGLLKKRKQNAPLDAIAQITEHGFPEFDAALGRNLREQMGSRGMTRTELKQLVSQAEAVWDSKWLPWLDSQLCRLYPQDIDLLCTWICHEIAFGREASVKALKAIFFSLSPDETNNTVLNTLARLRYFEGDLTAGDAALASLSELHPEYDQKWALAEKANGQVKAKDWDGLEDTLGHLLRVNPGDINIISLSVRAYAESGNHARILELLDDIGGPSEISNEYINYLYLNALDLCGQKARCLNEGVEILDVHPDFFSLYFLLRSVAHSLDAAHVLEPVFETAARLHPNHPLVREVQCLAALDRDDFAKVDEILETFEDKSCEPYLRLQLTYKTTQPGAQGVREAYEAYRASGVRHIGPEVQYAGYLIGSASHVADLTYANDILVSQKSRGAHNINYAKMLIQSHVALEQYDEAEACFEALPEQMRKALPLKEAEQYFLQRNGAHRDVSATWKEMATSGGYRSVTNASALPERVTFNYDANRDQVLVFACVYNAIEFTEWFLNYYRTLGVDHFIIVDNGSTDGTGDALKDEPDVSLFSQPGSFKDSAHGVYWINHLMRTYAVGKWAFFVDMDEAFVYPGMSEGRSLDDLLSYCDANGYEAMPSFMLDMFPASSGTDFSASDCFDNSYFAFPSMRAPYRTIQGGFRSRLTDRNFLITKSPLVKVNEDFYYLENNHTHTHLPVADIQTTLLHYKFIGDAQQRFDEAVDRKQHFMGARFYKDLQRSKTADRFERVECTLTYENAAQLEGLDLIKGSDAWRAFK